MLINESESPLQTYKSFRAMMETLSQTSVPISQPKHLNLPSLSGLANTPPPQPTPKTDTLKSICIHF